MRERKLWLPICSRKEEIAGERRPVVGGHWLWEGNGECKRDGGKVF